MTTDKQIIESVYDTIMKNTQYKNIDLTIFKNAFIDYNKKEIDLGKYIISIKKKGKNNEKENNIRSKI